jgi:hypothetical protein
MYSGIVVNNVLFSSTETTKPSDDQNNPGLAGQNKVDPKTKVFGHHFIVLDGNHIYDPSYGEDYGTLNAWATACIAGFVWNTGQNSPDRYEPKTNDNKTFVGFDGTWNY